MSTTTPETWAVITELVLSIGVGTLILLALLAVAFYFSERAQSRAEVTILVQLIDGPKLGLDLIRDSNGALRRGSIYGYLTSLENRGRITSRPVPLTQEESKRGQIPRRIYSLAESSQ